MARAEYDSLLQMAEQMLDRVDRALSDLDGGTYGTCATCGAPISDEELASDPTARQCGAHASDGAK